MVKCGKTRLSWSAKMPNRYLRESFTESERVNSVTMQAELFWLHLLVNVDDFGRCEANPELLRARLFPLRLETIRKASVSGWIAECESAQLVRRYEIAGKQYLQMERWEKGRAEKSKYPDPPLAGENICKQPNANAPDSVPVPDFDPDSDSPKPPKQDFSAYRLRLGALFGRRSATEWSDDELKKFKKVKPERELFEDELRLIEWFYLLEQKPNALLWRRKELVTLLNNWNGELDKARAQRGFKRDLGEDIETIPTPEQIERARKNQELL